MKLPTRTTLMVIGIGVVAIVGLFIYAGATMSAPSIVTGLVVSRPNLVVSGSNLGAVELWAIPTGTNVTESEYIKLGDAALATPHGAQEAWNFPIPKDPILATEIIAKAFDLDGHEIGRASLPFIGATELNNALWPVKN